MVTTLSKIVPTLFEMVPTLSEIVPALFQIFPTLVFRQTGPTESEIGILLPNNQRPHRTLHIQKDALPYALC